MSTDVRKTKIVATVGPASREYEMLEKLAKTGVNIVRFNFSHETQDEHLKVIDRVKQINKDLDTNMAILIDTKGPEIRCGLMENSGIEFAKGDIVSVVKEDVVGN